jgi:hypothetical protein
MMHVIHALAAVRMYHADAYIPCMYKSIRVIIHQTLFMSGDSGPDATSTHIGQASMNSQTQCGVLESQTTHIGQAAPEPPESQTQSGVLNVGDETVGNLRGRNSVVDISSDSEDGEKGLCMWDFMCALYIFHIYNGDVINVSDSDNDPTPDVPRSSSSSSSIGFDVSSLPTSTWSYSSVISSLLSPPVSLNVSPSSSPPHKRKRTNTETQTEPDVEPDVTIDEEH